MNNAYRNCLSKMMDGHTVLPRRQSGRTQLMLSTQLTCSKAESLLNGLVQVLQNADLIFGLPFVAPYEVISHPVQIKIRQIQSKSSQKLTR